MRCHPSLSRKDSEHLIRVRCLRQYTPGLNNVPITSKPTCFRFRQAAPKTIQFLRWYRLTPNPALWTSLESLLFLFSAFSDIQLSKTINDLRIFVKQLANNGGEGGIRTRGQIAPTHAFQACLLNHCSTSPRRNA